MLALAAVRAVQDPALLAAAKAEHAQSCPDGYRCPLPEDARPEPAAEL